MKLYNISNAGEFLTRVLDCKGMKSSIRPNTFIFGTSAQSKPRPKS